MSERSKTFKLDLDGNEIEIVVSRATTRMGIRRSLMIYAAMDAHDKAGKDEDEVAYILSYRTLPDLVAGTESVKGLDFPPKMEDLLDLPEDFVSEWMQAIYELNPQWNPANLITNDMQGKKTNT